MSRHPPQPVSRPKPRTLEQIEVDLMLERVSRRFDLAIAHAERLERAGRNVTDLTRRRRSVKTPPP